ncbi:hypothetical protein [Actinoplanes sichuanensis]|uniref:Lipoprotein n=1 Tax=Actinoplanes sichuanensis TaxID=512349 RepID=A0ABW4AQW1_9ACTN|nr:hypothetical protein [Actinoplanes sichuanensis]
MRLSAVLLVMVLGLTGCGPSGEQMGVPTGSPVVLSPEETAATAAVQNIVADAQLLDPENPLRREDPKSEWKAGGYRLIVSCSGNGVLRVGFRIGAALVEQDLRACAPAGGFGALDLEIPADAEGHSVEVTAVDDANGAVAYAVRRKK